MKNQANILVIEDDKEFLSTLIRVLNKKGYQAEGAFDASEALKLAKSNIYNIVISDVRLPGGIDGIEVVRQIKEINPNKTISIIITGYADIDAPIRAIKVKVDDYVIKPFKLKDFIETVDRNLKALQEEKDKRYFKDIDQQKLNPEFIDNVSKMRKLFEKIKVEMEEKEELLSYEEKVKIVIGYKEKYFNELMKYFFNLNSIVADFGQQEYEIHKSYIRNNILHLFSSEGSVLNKQIVDKPLGYAGDYVVADYFYTDGYSGKTLFGMFMDRFTLETPLPQAHKNRRFYLGKLVQKLSKEKGKGILKVTSFACGPAPEVFDTFDKKINNVKFNLLDGEQEVISFLDNKLLEYKAFKKNVKLFKSNILNLVRKKENLNIPKQDLIYCAGFFDYIKKTTGALFIKYMLELLEPGGWLIVVNVSMHDVNDVCLKMLADWYLYHRSKDDLLEMAPKDNVKQKKIWADYHTKRNLYLIIKKK